MYTFLSLTPKTLLTFHAIREEEFDYITDVNGKKVLKERSFCCMNFEIKGEFRVYGKFNSFCS